MEWQAAYERSSGYLELGLVEDALEELRGHESVKELLGYRSLILIQLERWAEGESAGSALVVHEPGTAQNWINWAYCMRRAQSILKARPILEQALCLFPGEAMIHYNLGCYACVLGETETAKNYLDTAFRLDPEWRLEAIKDEDLASLSF